MLKYANLERMEKAMNQIQRGADMFREAIEYDGYNKQTIEELKQNLEWHKEHNMKWRGIEVDDYLIQGFEIARNSYYKN